MRADDAGAESRADDVGVLPGSIRALAVSARLGFRTAPRLAIAAFVLTPVGWMTGSVTALWIRVLADGAVNGSTRMATVAAAGLVGTTALRKTTDAIGGRVLRTFEDQVALVFYRRLAEIAAGTPGIEQHERPEYVDRLQLLQRDAWIAHWMFQSFAEFLGSVAQTIVTVALLASLHPVLALLPVLGIPSLVASAVSRRRVIRSQEAAAEPQRLARHLRELATTPGPAKEVRVFGLQDELVRRRREAWWTGHVLLLKANWLEAWWTFASSLVFAAGFVGAVAFMTLRAASGRATPGDALLAFLLAGAMNRNIAWLAEMTSWLHGCLDVSRRFVWLLDLATPRRPAVAAVPEALRDGIVLDRVSFRYPGTEALVLDDVSLRLGAGSVVAIVGENGAGKTSIVKLLTRMYEPQSGRILVDRAPLDDLDVVEWRSRVAGAFQDFARFEWLLRETVGAGDVPRIEDATAVDTALVRGGAVDVAAAVGKDTQLGPAWPGGAELSGGQWQKLALARGLMRDRPLLLVLDEPTAALDAPSESALFERFAGAARTAGVATLLVSHRFSTVRIADTIVVLDAGRVIEQGSHDELLARGGLYAELYEIQAKAYR